MKTSGRKPLIDPGPKVILACCLFSFLTTPIFWVAAQILRKQRRREEGFTPDGSGFGSALSRAYALLYALLSILFCAGFLRAPFLTYWPELPGWIDGISLAENLFLALPTLLALMGTGLVLFAIRTWHKKYWSLFWRLHYTWLTVCLAAFVVLLARWHLVGFSFYWEYFIK